MPPVSRSTQGRFGLLIFSLFVAVNPLSAAGPAGDEGLPFMQNFSPRDYHANTQCWSAVQDARGLMYVSNYAEVLEYDGSSWRKIPVGKTGWITRMAYEASTDSVFIGGDTTLGYLKTAPGGERVFVSLLDQLPADARETSGVRGVYATSSGVFFVGQTRVMRWRDGHFKVWPFNGSSRLRHGWAAGSFYVQSPEIGLRRLEGDDFVPGSSDPLFSHTSVKALITSPNGEVLIATYHDGLFILRDGLSQPWNSALSGFLKEKGIYQILLLRDGSLAIATDSAGLVILDKEGRFRSHVDDAGGLHGNNLLSLFEDAEGGLWIGLQAGITRAEIDSPLSILRAGPGDDLSSMICGNHWFGTMVLGTLSGMYRLVGADPGTATGAHLERIPGATDTFTSEAAVENGLLLAASGKVVLLDAKGQTTTVFTTNSSEEHLRPSLLHPGQILVGEENGHVTALRLDAATRQWGDAGVVGQTGKPGVIYGMAESAPGNLWMGTNEHGLFLSRSGPGGGTPVTTSLLDEPGPLHGEPAVWIASDGGPIFFQTPRKLYRLDESGQNVRLATEYGAQFVDGSNHLESVLGYDENSLWVTAGPTDDVEGDEVYGRAVAGANGQPPVFHNLPRKIEEVIGRVQGFFPVNVPPEKLTTLLISGSTGNGLVRLDVPRWEARLTPTPLATLIRRAVTTNHETSVGAQPPILQDPLPFTRNSAHFEYAANTFAFHATPRFQTRLENFQEGKWSDFSDRNSVDYTNLLEGNYTFQARARNTDGQLGSVASLSFRVLPPWQRTPLAYASYVLALALGIAGLVRWRGRQLRRHNAALETLVATRTSELRGREADLLAHERDLVRARDDAEAANRAKSAFLANMSHELRTPLNAILGYSQILLKNSSLPARSREQLTVIGQSGNHLLAMINEVLDLAKVEAGQLALTPSDFALDPFLDGIGAVFRPRLAEKGLGYQDVRAPGLPVMMHTDMSRLRQVLLNLLSNAVKFTPRGAVRLEVTLTDAADRIGFAVTDTGIGIAEDQRGDIFLAFHQAGDNQLVAQGTGLGLPISQRLVGLLGGHIQVESTPEQGSRFWFDLSLFPARAQAMPTALNPSGEALGTITGYQGAPRRLLIVDDEAENRRVLRDLLQPLGFEIEETATGAQCLEHCARRLPDAVLLDLRMGQVDGFEVARTLRQRHADAPLAILAVSASVFESDRQQAIDAGCDDFVPKPFKEEQLLAVLGRVLGLAWVYATGPAPVEPAGDGPEADPAPSSDEIEAMLELSLRGDILGIKKRLGALRAANPGGAGSFVQRLELLVANYQMDRIRDVLTKWKENENG